MRPATKEKSEFNKRLIQLRNNSNLTQFELAEKLGITRDAVAYYESKAKNPGVEIIQLLAGFFGVSSDILLGVKKHSRSRGAQSKLEKQLELIRSLPTKQQKAISTVLDMALKNVL